MELATTPSFWLLARVVGLFLLLHARWRMSAFEFITLTMMALTMMAMQVWLVGILMVLLGIPGLGL